MNDAYITNLANIKCNAEQLIAGEYIDKDKLRLIVKLIEDISLRNGIVEQVNSQTKEMKD